MPKPERTFVEKITTIAGAIAALGGVLAAATQFSDQVKALLGKLAELPAPAWWMIAAVLLSVGIFGLMHGLARRSRLLRPEALLLKSHKAEHLKGREEDIDRLLKLCREHPLVHLVGESGAGKSALLQAGLCPKLREDSAGLLPIYVEVWGQDWEAGPRSALTEAFWQALSEADQQALKPKTDDLFATLKRCRPSLRRTLLLIFDQFDDYQTRHRDRFLSSRQRTWLGAEKLVAANAFWREIKTLLDEDAIHCLFVTRLDAADGLKSVRFIKEEVYRLDRLQENIVVPLLTELTSSIDENAPVIYAPERGWDKLKERLANDLSQSGAVLPAQMKIALQGLARLKTLTIGDYQRLGGLPGLEARHIEAHIAEAERHFAHTKQGAQLTQKQIRGLLLALVNRETLKTVPRSNEELEQIIIADNVGEAKPMQQTVQDCLDYLQQREIIRKRIDPDTRRQLWLLDHDYLCAGVLEAERRANRWLALAAAGSRAFQEAGSHILKKWRALLNPWQQLVLVMQRLLGRFRYGTLRAYALWSLLRFVPYVLVLTLASYGWYRFSAREQASKILSRFGVVSEIDGTPTTSEIEALWALAASNDAVRFSFLEQALSIPENAERFNRRAEILTQAISGLNPARREKILKETLLPHLQHPVEKRLKIMCVKMGIVLIVQDSTFTSLAIQLITEKMHFEMLDQILAVVPNKLSAEIANRTFAPILALLVEYPYHDESQAKILAALAEKLTTEYVDSAFAQILTCINKVTNTLERGYLMQDLTEALIEVAEELAPENANRAFAQILPLMENTNESNQLQSLTKALTAVARKLSSEYAYWAFSQILICMEKTTDPYVLQSLAKALAAASGRFAFEDADRAFTQILARMEKTKNSYMVQSGSSAFNRGVLIYFALLRFLVHF